MIYLFDKDEKLIKIVRKSAVKTALQKYALTTERYVSDRLTVELKGLNADELEQVEYMAIQTMEDAHTFHYFYVAQKFSDELTTLIGVQSGIEELRKSPVYDKRPKNALARDVITDLLTGTNWQARFVSETTPHSTNFYYTSVFDALKKVCEVWDLEMQFFVEMNGNRIGGRYIDFKQRIGEAVGKRVVYGHNALQILQEVERTNIFTALVGRGKGEETGDGYGRKITFEDVVWSRTQGKPVDKPKGQKYLELPLMTRQYGIKNADGSMRPKIGFVDFSEEENSEVLIERTYRALIDAARPQLTLKTSSVYLKGAKVGDTIRVVRHDKKLDYETRIFEITFNRLNNQSSDIKLGDRIGESNEAKAQTIADKAIDNFVANEFSNFVQNLPDYLPSADGFNNNWYGAEDPSKKHLGKVLINDIWYKPDPEHEGHKIMLRWTGEVWEEILRTYDSEALRDRIAEEVVNVNRTMLANESERDRQIADIVGKFNDNKLLANEAKQVADRANQSIAGQAQEMQQLRTTLADNKREVLTEANQAATNAFNRAEQLLNQSQSTLSAEIATVSQTLSEAKRNLLEQANAQTELSSRVTTVEETANGMKTTVTELQKTVNVTTGNLDAVSRRTKTVEDNLSGLTTRFEKVRLDSRNLLDLTKLTRGGYKGSNGMTVNDQSYSFLEPTLVKSDEQYILQTWTAQVNSNSWIGYIFLNSDLQVVPNSYTSYYPATQSHNKWHITAPKNAKYIQFSLSNDFINDNSPLKIQFERGVEETEYNQYSEMATFKNSVDVNLAELTRTTQTVTDRVTEYKSAFDQTAEHFRTSLNALEAFKNDEGARESRYLSLSREETARQLLTVRSDITRDYVSKSQLTETTRGIEQRFERLTTGRNLVKNSKIKESSNVYDFAQRTVELEAGKTYLFMARAKKTGGSADKTVRVYLYNWSWSEATHLEFSGNDYETLTTSFTPRENGRYYISSYWFPNGGDRSGTADIDWYMVVEGGIKPSDWLPHVDDASSELATYKNTVDRQLSELSSTINTNNSDFTTFKNSYERTAQGVTEKLTAFEAYRNDEHLRSNAYFEASKAETARQLREERTAISENYIAKSRYEADARGIRERFEGLSVGSNLLHNSRGPFKPQNNRIDNYNVYLNENVSIFLEQDVEYTIKANSNVRFSANHNPSVENDTCVLWLVSYERGHEGSTIVSDTNTGTKGTTFVWRRPSGIYYLRVNGYKIDNSTFAEKVIISKGNVSVDWSPSDEDTETRLTEFSRGIDGQISTVSRAVKDNNDVFLQFKTKIIQTAEGLVSEVSGPGGLKSQMSQLKDSWAVKNLTGSGTILNQLNLNRDGSVKIDGKLVQITGTTHIQDGVITSAKIASLDAGKVTTGTLDAANVNIINLNANNVVGLDAKFIKAKIESALVEWLKGKVITAQNDAMRINLNQANITFNHNATIDFNSASNALVRRRGTHTAFLHFANEVNGGVYAGLGVTSTNDGVNSQSSGRFSGVRIFRTARGGTWSSNHEAAVDEVQIYGDVVKLRHGFDDQYGWDFSTSGIGITVNAWHLHNAVVALSNMIGHMHNVGFLPFHNNDFKNAFKNNYNQLSGHYRWNRTQYYW